MSRNQKTEFQDKITGTKAAVGVVTCLMYSVGLVILSYSVSSEFKNLSLLTYILAVVLFGKTAISSTKGISAGKIAVYTLLAIILQVSVSQLLFTDLLQPNLMKLLSVEQFSSANTAGIMSKIQNGSIGRKIWMIFGCCVLGPVVEELLYRVALFRVIYQKNRSLAHFVTALFFGLQHVIVAAVYQNHPQEFLLIGSYMAYSYIFTRMYEKTKTPVPGMLAHMLINAAGLFFML